MQLRTAPQPKASLRLVVLSCCLLLILGAAIGLLLGGGHGPAAMTEEIRLVRLAADATVDPPRPTITLSRPLPPPLRSAEIVGEDEQVARGEQALALLEYPWKQLGWDIHFLRAEDGYLGRTLVGEQRIEVYLRPGQEPTEIAATVAHELGHVVDVRHLSDADRAHWLAVRGIDPATPWWPCDDCSDYTTGSGDFAEVFSYWLVGGTFRSRLAPPPDQVQLQSLLPLLRADDG